MAWLGSKAIDSAPVGPRSASSPAGPESNCPKISRKAPLRYPPVDREAIESWLDRPPRVRGPNLVARGRSRREGQFQIQRFTATVTRTDCLAFKNRVQRFSHSDAGRFSSRCHLDEARVAELARRAALTWSTLERQEVWMESGLAGWLCGSVRVPYGNARPSLERRATRSDYARLHVEC